jgi:hypothetical protein
LLIEVEDSFILLDALEQDALELRAMRPTLCLEIGSVIGLVVSTFLSILLDTLEPGTSPFDPCNQKEEELLTIKWY